MLRPSPRRLVERVLKQICSIEATAGLWHPVDKSETEYYAYVKNPISLSKIDGKWRAGKYVGEQAWRAFAADVQLLIDNAQDFNDDDTLPFTLAGMVRLTRSRCGRSLLMMHALVDHLPASTPPGPTRDAAGDQPDRRALAAAADLSEAARSDAVDAPQRETPHSRTRERERDAGDVREGSAAPAANALSKTTHEP